MRNRAYSTLTARGQARRLRILAAKALSLYDLEVRRLRLVTNEMNGIFRVDAGDGCKYILRVTLPEGGHTRDHVAAEMDWLAALARETDLCVPRPLAARDGALVVEAAAPGVPQPRLCALFTWIPGRDLAEDLTSAQAARLGELMARLHNHALTYRPPARFSLLRFDRVFPFPEPVVLFEERFTSLFPPERRAVYEHAIAWVQESLDRLMASGEPMRILHNDLHQWNVRSARGVLSPIDFEDLMYGWPVQDIATTWYYFPAGNLTELAAAFRSGYTRNSPWPERYPGEIDSFIAARGVGLANFVLNDPGLAGKPDAAGFVVRVEDRLCVLLARRDMT